MILGPPITSGRAAPDPPRRGGGGCPPPPATAVPRERPGPGQGSPRSWATRRGLEFAVKLCSCLPDLVAITEGGGRGGCGAGAGEVAGVGRGERVREGASSLWLTREQGDAAGEGRSVRKSTVG